MKEELQQKNNDKTFFGFWVYLMTDLLMFAALFATYAVLRNNTFGAPSGKELFSLPYVLIETLILLTSSFTVGIGTIYARAKDVVKTSIFFGATFILGVVFLWMEVAEFAHLFAEGNTPQRSAFLSSYFTLVGTHGLHITSGLLWMVLIFIFILKRGMSDSSIRKLTLLGIFWHFLDIVWIFIFTIVYLLGAI
ncbi:MAG TPA: cytochrome o ubiquinol oxidase subunit III [Patescibacteria group bacterium]